MMYAVCPTYTQHRRFPDLVGTSHLEVRAQGKRSATSCGQDCAGRGGSDPGFRRDIADPHASWRDRQGVAACGLLRAVRCEVRTRMAKKL